MADGGSPTDALASKLKRTELQHQASSVPGRDIVQVLTEIPVGVESGWHVHRAKKSAISSRARSKCASTGSPA